MRGLQVVLFLAAVVTFVAALFFVGTDTGDTLWRAGIALLFIDTVSLMLWPTGAPDQS